MERYRWELIPPGDPRIIDAAMVGAKAANLSRALLLGYRVPEMLVMQLRANAHGQDLSESHPGETGGNELPFKGEDVESSLLGQAISALRESSSASSKPRFIVRSSSQDEDREDFSHPGQFLSLVVDDHPALLAQALNRVCTAGRPSLEGESSEAAQAPSLGVMVNILVDAKASGVCFSHHPSSRAPGCMAIEHVKGQGFGMNQPLVKPARATLLRSGEAVIRRAGSQSIVVTSWGYEIVPNQRVDPLEPQFEARLWEMAMALERDFGFGVDMEWCIDAEGEIILLQVRPITTPVPLDPIGPN